MFTKEPFVVQQETEEERHYCALGLACLRWMEAVIRISWCQMQAVVQRLCVNHPSPLGAQHTTAEQLPVFTPRRPQ